MKRILVVDDDRVAVNGLSNLLGLDGYQAIGVIAPAEAVERVRTETFDALITDLEMPEVHGLEVLRAAKSAQRNLPVWVVTAYADSPASATALALGAIRIFPKPLNYDLLIAELNAWFCR